jgi:hypothetical protein
MEINIKQSELNGVGLFDIYVTIFCYSQPGIMTADAGYNGILISVSLLVSVALTTHYSHGNCINYKQRLRATVTMIN